MPEYVYGCDEYGADHPRVEVVHKMSEDPVIHCKECGSTMHRVPQSTRFGPNPAFMLRNWLSHNYRRYKARKQGKRVGKFSPYKVKDPDFTGAGRDFETRKYNKEQENVKSKSN